MRMMVNWKMDVEAGNRLIEEGKLAESVDEMIRRLKPEAAYFFANEGCRGGLMVFDMADTAQIPIVAEPLFLQYKATVDFIPVMNADDVRKALASVSG